MPQLQSSDPRAIEAALLSISALDSKLATDLATLFRSPGAVSALSKIASSPNPEVARLATESLGSLFESLRSAVVTILDKNNRQIGSGFFISPDGHVLTTHYVVDRQAESISVKWKGYIYKASIIAQRAEVGLAVVKIEGRQFPNLPIGAQKPIQVFDLIFALIFERELGWRLETGRIIGLDSSLEELPGQLLMITDLCANRGADGTPVVDTTGNVIGVIYSMKTDETLTIILPAEPISRFIENLGLGKNV